MTTSLGYSVTAARQTLNLVSLGSNPNVPASKIEVKMTAGIYGIFSSRTGECLYIGQSRNIEYRCSVHLQKLSKETHSRKDFNQWFKKENKEKDSLIFSILEESSLENQNLNSLEIKWFNSLSPRFFGKTPSLKEKWAQTEASKKRIAEGVRKSKGNTSGVNIPQYKNCYICKKKTKSVNSICCSCKKTCHNCIFDLQFKEKILQKRQSGKSLRIIALELRLPILTKPLMRALERYEESSKRAVHNFSF